MFVRSFWFFIGLCGIEKVFYCCSVVFIIEDVLVCVVSDNIKMRVLISWFESFLIVKIGIKIYCFIGSIIFFFRDKISCFFSFYFNYFCNCFWFCVCICCVFGNFYVFEYVRVNYGVVLVVVDIVILCSFIYCNF